MFEWIDVRDHKPTEPYDEEYMVCIKGATEATSLAFDGDRFYDPITNQRFDVEYWHKFPKPPKISGMIEANGIKAFRGVMYVSGVGRLDGDFVYNPSMRHWLHGESGRGYPLSDCTVEEVFGCPRQ